MNEKEKIVLQTIKQNPFLSQQEMAEQLNISRPTLANLISGLIRKGEIVGRAYVLPEKDTIIAIGGANVDRKFRIEGNVQYGISNPTTVSESVGGVARNVSENLGRLGNKVKLITAFGNDHDAQTIQQKSQAFVEFDLVERMQNANTGSYTAVLDSKGDLIIAMANMSIYDELQPNRLKKHESILYKAKGIIVDLNCSKETVQYIQQIVCKRNIPFAIVPVSAPKMKNMPHDLVGVTYFICNQEEAEYYLNMKIFSFEDGENAIKKLMDRGAKNIVITFGEKGVIVGNDKNIEHFSAKAVEKVIDVTGAGDAFVGAFLHSALNGDPLADAVKFGIYNSSKTLQSNRTVREDLTEQEYMKWRKR